MLQPADKTLKTMAIEFAEYQVSYIKSLWKNDSLSTTRMLRISLVFSYYDRSHQLIRSQLLQVCVDVFLTTQSYVDIASISVIPKTTGGQVTILACLLPEALGYDALTVNGIYEHSYYATYDI